MHAKIELKVGYELPLVGEVSVFDCPDNGFSRFGSYLYAFNWALRSANTSMTETLGYGAALLIGISLGLIGGGGSILTIPVLVYLLHVQPILATAYSLFIVGFSSLIGSVYFFRKRLVHFKTAVTFGLPAVLSVFLTRLYIVPAIPERVFSGSVFEVGRNTFIMVFFATLMILSAVSMIREKEVKDAESASAKKQPRYRYVLIVLEGLAVGLLTGVLGAGGGFIIIPVLVLVTGLPMKKAIGTSLVIIAAKSLIGFLGDLSNLTMNWTFLLAFTAISIIGVFVGTALSSKIAGRKLKLLFGWFVLLMGFYVLVKEFA